MFAAVTDHVFVDGGHTLDFTNKAFEMLDHLGWDAAPARPAEARPADRRRAASRGEGEWRHPDDLAELLGQAGVTCPRRLRQAGPGATPRDDDVAGLAWAAPRGRPGRDRRGSRWAAAPAPRRRSWAGRRLAAGYASPASTSRTTTATGTSSTTASRPPTPSTSCVGRAHARAAAGACTRRAQGLPRPVPQRAGGPAARPPPRAPARPDLA